MNQQDVLELKAEFLNMESALAYRISKQSRFLDKWEKTLGTLSGYRRILQQIEFVEKGAGLGYLQKRLETNLDMLRSNHIGVNSSVDNFQSGVEQAWLELKNLLEIYQY